MTGPNENPNWESLWDDLGLTSPEPTAQKSRVESQPEPARVAPEHDAAEIAPSSSIQAPVSNPIELAQEEPSAAAGEESRPARGGRGRRRGRRGGRSGSSEAAPPGDVAPTPQSISLAPEATEAGENAALTEEATSAEGEAAREERRGRRRRRRRRGDERESPPRKPAPAESEQEEPAEETIEVAEDDNAEEDDLSNWSVPSWQDLIASLYRPDR